MTYRCGAVGRLLTAVTSARNNRTIHPGTIVTKAPELKPILDILAAIMPSVNCIYDNIIGPAIEFGCAFIPS